MRNNRFNHESNIVRGIILIAFTLFTMMSFTALAHAQQSKGRPLATTHLHNAPSGNANLNWNSQNKTLTVILHITGLQPGSTHAAHIHAGTCSAKGAILYPLNNVVADAAGNATSAATIMNLAGGIPAEGWNITVHSGPTAQTGSLLCGNVVNPQGATSLSVPLFLN